jgi:hypothetical protein
MAKPRMDLSAFVGKLLEEQYGDALREGIRVLSQALMETEVTGLIGADRYERKPERRDTATGIRCARGIRASARLSWPSRRCVPGRISLVAAAAPTRRTRAAGGPALAVGRPGRPRGDISPGAAGGRRLVPSRSRSRCCRTHRHPWVCVLLGKTQNTEPL